MSDSILNQPDPNPYAPPSPSSVALSSQAPSSETALAWTSEPIVESLRQTRPWVFFLSIVAAIIA